MTPMNNAGESGPSIFIQEAAAVLRVSRRTIYYWIRAGRLRTVRTRGGSQRVLLSSIAAVQLSSPPLRGPNDAV